MKARCKLSKSGNACHLPSLQLKQQILKADIMNIEDITPKPPNLENFEITDYCIKNGLDKTIKYILFTKHEFMFQGMWNYPSENTLKLLKLSKADRKAVAETVLLEVGQNGTDYELLLENLIFILGIDFVYLRNVSENVPSDTQRKREQRRETRILNHLSLIESILSFGVARVFTDKKPSRIKTDRLIEYSATIVDGIDYVYLLEELRNEGINITMSSLFAFISIVRNKYKKGSVRIQASIWETFFTRNNTSKAKGVFSRRGILVEKSSAIVTYQSASYFGILTDEDTIGLEKITDYDTLEKISNLKKITGNYFGKDKIEAVSHLINTVNNDILNNASKGMIGKFQAIVEGQRKTSKLRSLLSDLEEVQILVDKPKRTDDENINVRIYAKSMMFEIQSAINKEVFEYRDRRTRAEEYETELYVKNCLNLKVA